MSLLQYSAVGTEGHSIPAQASVGQGADSRQEGAGGSFRAVNAGIISAMLRFLQWSAICSFSVIGSGQSVKHVLDIRRGDSLGNLHVSEICAEEQSSVFISF